MIHLPHKKLFCFLDFHSAMGAFPSLCCLPTVFCVSILLFLKIEECRGPMKGKNSNEKVRRIGRDTW